MDLVQWWEQQPIELRQSAARIVLAVVALALIWLLRKTLAAIVVTPLRRLAARTNSRWDAVLLDVLLVPARFVIVAVGLAVGAQILGLDRDTFTFVSHLVRTLVIVAVTVAAYRLIDLLTPSSGRVFGLTGMRINDRLLPFVRTAAKITLMALALVIIIQEWGYDVSGLVAGLGLGGLAFSLAAKDTVENLFGFTTILGDQPFVVGEFIKTGDVEGTVEHVGIRSTRIRQPDQAYVTVPNNKLANAAIRNWSRLVKRWYNVTLLIDYEANSREIEALLARVKTLLESREQVEKDSILTRFIDFTDTGIQVLVRCYVQQSDWARFTEEKEAINLGILKIVEELGLRIALPRQSLYFEGGERPTAGAASSSSSEETA